MAGAITDEMRKKVKIVTRQTGPTPGYPYWLNIYVRIVRKLEAGVKCRKV